MTPVRLGVVLQLAGDARIVIAPRAEAALGLWPDGDSLY
jgi:hypothetical protein